MQPEPNSVLMPPVVDQRFPPAHHPLHKEAKLRFRLVAPFARVGLGKRGPTGSGVAGDIEVVLLDVEREPTDQRTAEGILVGIANIKSSVDVIPAAGKCAIDPVGKVGIGQAEIQMLGPPVRGLGQERAVGE